MLLQTPALLILLILSLPRAYRPIIILLLRLPSSVSRLLVPIGPYYLACL
jgi:hypothetical protein